MEKDALRPVIYGSAKQKGYFHHWMIKTNEYQEQYTLALIEQLDSQMIVVHTDDEITFTDREP